MPSHNSGLPHNADTLARTWDGSPHTKYEWFESLQHTLTSKDISYRTLWQSGYIVDRSKVLVCNATHAKHLAIGNVAKQTFDKPTTLFNFKVIDATKDVSSDAVDPSRYVIAPEMLDAKDRSLFAAIADTLDNQKRREDYERKADGSGLELIKLLAKEIDQASAEISQWAARRLADVVAAGLASPTTVGFDAFRKQYEEANNQLPTTRRNQPSVIADTYVSVVRQLGDNIGTRLDMQLTVARIAKGADQQLDLNETISCILDILGDSELRHTGHALKANRDNRPPLIWSEGKHEICSICKGKHGGGKHLRRDCPDKPTDPIKRPKADRPSTRNSATKGAAKRVAASEDSDDSLHDLWEADAPLSALFSDDDDPMTDKHVHFESPESSSETTGSALVAQQANRGSCAANTDESRTPTRPSIVEARRLVERLSPASPMKEFSEVERAIGSGTSLRTGGSDRRSRIEILSEMRAAVGLSPVVIPVGLPVGSPSPTLRLDPPRSTPPQVEFQPQHTAVQAELSNNPPRHSNSASEVSSVYAPRASNPLDVTQEPGAPALVGFAIKADNRSRVVHEYTFAGSAKRSWTHLASGAKICPRPPPRSTFLGRSKEKDMTLWGTETGELVMCRDGESSPTSTSTSTPDSPHAAVDSSQPQRPAVRRTPQTNSSSPIRNLAIAVISLAGALAAVTLGANAPGGTEPPFDPGASTSIDPCAGVITTLVLLSIGFHTARQANRRGGRQGREHRSAPTTPSLAPDRWEPFYRRDISSSLQQLSRAMRARRASAVVWIILHLMALKCLSSLAFCIGLSTSKRGNGRPMLPDSSVGAASKQQSLRLLLLWCTTTALYSSAFAIDPLASTSLSISAHVWLSGQHAVPNNIPQGRESWTPGRASTHHHSTPGKCPESMLTTNLGLRGYALRCLTSGSNARRGKPRKAKRRDLISPACGNSSWTRRRWVDLVIDSGCTWHIHNRLDELINLRACSDVVEDAAGKQIACTQMGDLPLLIRSSQGVEFCFLLRDVRWAPNFPDSLISVDQLWAASRADCIFRDEQRIQFTLNHTNRGEPLTSPFRRIDGLYRWTVAVARLANTGAASISSSKKLKPGIHAAGSTSHLGTLPSDTLAALLHRRLHVGLGLIRRLGELSSDTPPHIHSASAITCAHCAEANSTRLPHSSSEYEPTHPGRLIHADIAGPFKSSRHGGYRYCLIMVDDHSRYKFAYFLHRRSEARDKVKQFVAEFNAVASQHSALPIRKVGKLRSDNAGEFVSREFADMLDDAGVNHTTSPPYVHQLNGVAERAIRSTFGLARSYLTASGLAPEFWPHAVEMAVDVLNRTAGPPPPHDVQTSYEAITGRRPRVLGLMPFGCRAFAVKPREQYNKTTIDPRAWVGINLGRSSLSPSAYKIWCPSTGRVVVTSDAYFMEHYYPQRPKGFRVDDELGAVPTAPPSLGDRSNSPDASEPGPAAGHALSVGGDAYGHRVRRTLLLFSGNEARPDGLAAMLRRRGVEVVCVDNDPTKSEAARDILNDSCFIDLLERAKQGEFHSILAAPPCSTYSISRFFKPIGSRSGAPIVRSRQHVLGLPNLPLGHDREVRRANEVTRRTCAILAAAHSAGAEFVIENPADRGDAAIPHLFQFAEHAPIWIDPHMIALRKTVHLSSATFAQCMIGGASQKYTTLWYTGGLCSLDHLRGLSCAHAPGAHSQAAGGIYDEERQTWNSAQAAAYPADLNALLASALVDSMVNALPNNDARWSSRPSEPEQHPDAPRAPAGPPSRPTALSSEGRQRPTSTDTPPTDLEPTIPIAAAVDEPTAAAELINSPSPAPSTSVDTPAVKRKYQRRTFDIREKAPDGKGYFGLRSQNFAKAAASADGDPSNHREAMRLDAAGWGQAEAKEIDNHEANESWQYIPRAELPAGRRVVKLTWVFKTKRGEDRKKKARLCVQGCSQVPGEDYDQTFCAAMRAGSLRTLCALAARLSLKMHRWDFVAAYLQGELEPGEVVYCSPPNGFGTSASTDGKVRLVPADESDGVQRLCKVVKPVYGMAQAGRRWQRTLFPWLLDWQSGGARLQQSAHDTCIFQCRQTVDTPSGSRDETLLIGCYVDDLFILASHTDEHSIYHRFTSDLQARWDVEDEGPVSDLLSIEIDQVDNQVRLRQTRYIEKLMSTYAPDGKPSSLFATAKLSAQPSGRTPCGPEIAQLVADALTQNGDEVDRGLLKAYQSLTGALLYCAVNTRPDVAYAVGMLCRAMGKPTRELLDAAYRVLYYLHHHRSIGLYYSACSIDLRGMSDADWAAHYSTTGFVFMLNQAAISWGSKKQSCVALSSCEAEIVALSEAAKEGVYLSRFLADLGFPPSDTVQLATDNSAARDLAYNPEHHERTKHIERRHFFIRNMVESHQLVVPYVTTTANLADFFTKSLPASDFYRHRNAIMNLPPRSESTIARAGGC